MRSVIFLMKLLCICMYVCMYLCRISPHTVYLHAVSLCVDLVEVRMLVSKGKSAELTCRNHGIDSPVVVEWRYRQSAGQSASTVSFNRHVSPRFRRRGYSMNSSNDSADFSLVISQVTAYNEGIYTCLIANQSAEMRRVVHLNVIGEIQSMFFLLFLILSISDGVLVNESIYIWFGAHKLYIQT